MNPKSLRYIIWPFWFVVVPAALAALAYNLIAPSEPAFGEPGFSLVGIQYWVKDQPVPALIILFTVFEMVLYSYRHSLPGAQYLAGNERSDLPKGIRREFEQASHLLDEAERIQRKNRSAVERALKSEHRSELNESLEDLRDAMNGSKFDEQLFLERYERASRLVSKHLGTWQKGELREYLESIGVAMAVAFLLRAEVVEAFKIPSGSMLPTLQIQDHIFVNKLAYGPPIPFTNQRLFPRLPPKRGDVMVFEYPEPDPNKEHPDYIKRVIATEGDTLVVEGGHPIINGWRVPSCKVGPYQIDESNVDSKPLLDADGKPVLPILFVEFLGEYSYLTAHTPDLDNERHQRLSTKVEGPYHAKAGETWVLGDNRDNSADSRAWNDRRGGGVPDANIKGRAMFVWLNFKHNGLPDFDRLFTHVLGLPKLPAGAPPEVVARIQECLKERPAPDLMVVPPPGSSDAGTRGLGTTSKAPDTAVP